MRLIIKSNINIYEATAPNYADDKAKEKILADAKWALPENEVIENHMWHSDDLTDMERKQLDIHGEIKYPFIELNLEA
jgi:hypothetical protein